MATSAADAPDKPKRHPVRRWLGWGLTVFVAVAWVIVVQKARPADALDLGRPLMVVPVLPLMLAGLVYWLVQGLCRLFIRRGGAWIPWAHLAVLAGAIMATQIFYEIPNPVRAEDEPTYLRFAAAVRNALNKPALKNGSVNLDASFVSSDEPLVEAEARRKLEPMLPIYWPRQWLKVYLDGETVVLYRGGGFGSVGVRISAIPEKSDWFAGDERSPSSSRRISDHVWFFSN